MTLSHNRKRALRIAFIAILVFSAGEVVWWMLDQRRMVRRESERIAALHDANRQAAERLPADGVAPERVPNRMRAHVVSVAGSNPACLAPHEPLSILFLDGFFSHNTNAWSAAFP